MRPPLRTRGRCSTPRRGRAPASRGGRRRRVGGRHRIRGLLKTPGTSRQLAPRAGRSVVRAGVVVLFVSVGGLRSLAAGFHILAGGLHIPVASLRVFAGGASMDRTIRRSGARAGRVVAPTSGGVAAQRAASLRAASWANAPTRRATSANARAGGAGAGGSAPARASPRRKVRSMSRRPPRPQGRERRAVPALGHCLRLRPLRREAPQRTPPAPWQRPHRGSDRRSMSSS